MDEEDGSPATQTEGKHFRWTPHPDWMQTMVLLLCLFDFGFFNYYLFRFEIDKQNTISETLFTDAGYSIVLTITLYFRLLAVVLFLCRFKKKQHQAWQIAGYVGASLAAIGWGWLAWNQDNTRHFSGVAVFCVGSFTYSFALVRLARTSRDNKERLHAIMEGFLLFAVVALVVSFVTLWVKEEYSGQHTPSGSQNSVQHAYIVEHTAYAVHLVFYTFFFLYHSPNRDKYVPTGNEKNIIPMECRPLIFQERLPVIMELRETGVA